MSEGYQALTEKEKQTLRLIVRGYDAKSLARRLGISVHTVNERLRHARRKMEVSSSREAARMLLDKEGEGPDFLAGKQMGAAGPAPGMGHGGAVADGLDPSPRRFWLIGGMLMSLVLAALALTSLSHVAEPAARSSQKAPVDAGAPAAEVGGEVVEAAQQWLSLVDQGRWDESWNATGQAFKELNTSEKWASVSEQVRPPLGEVLSRTAISQEGVPAPPYGYEMIKFRTSFANKADVTETVTLVREGSDWRVVGYWLS